MESTSRKYPLRGILDELILYRMWLKKFVAVTLVIFAITLTVFIMIGLVGV